MENQTRLRAIPAIGKLLHNEIIEERFRSVPHALLVTALSAVLESLRRQARENKPAEGDWMHMVSAAGIADEVEGWLKARFAPHLRSVINLTGTIIHTNLGRAPLCKRAEDAVLSVAGGYSNLEFEVQEGVRGSRHSHIESLLCELTGAEAAMAVNNNAAAVLLVLSTLAQGAEGIVSRGQLVEIGGSFRIPDIMAASGVQLVEVGTTNKTRLTDYDGAITAQTKVILRVHTSNYRIIGFTEQPSRKDLANLASRHGLPLFEDLGSGALFDYQALRIGDEPTVSESIADGVDVVSFSGDKLLGSAQAGLIVGKKQWIDPMKKHPLARAVRLDKMTLAALEATLLEHLDPQMAKTHIPVVRMVTESYDEVAFRSLQLVAAIREHERLSHVLKLSLRDGESTIGGGSFPGETLPTRLIALEVAGVSAESLAKELRVLPHLPIVSRVSQDQVVWDVRTLLPGQDTELLLALLEWLETRETG